MRTWRSWVGVPLRPEVQGSRQRAERRKPAAYGSGGVRKRGCPTGNPSTFLATFRLFWRRFPRRLKENRTPGNPARLQWDEEPVADNPWELGSAVPLAPSMPGFWRSLASQTSSFHPPGSRGRPDNSLSRGSIHLGPPLSTHLWFVAPLEARILVGS